MKKTRKYFLKAMIFSLSILLVGCSTNVETTTKGKDIENKLKKLHLTEGYSNFQQVGNGQIDFHIQTKDGTKLNISFTYDESKVASYTIEMFDNNDITYCYHDKETSFISYHQDLNEPCFYGLDGDVPSGAKLCQGKAVTKVKEETKALYDTPLKEANITKDDLVIFGNYFYQANKNRYETEDETKYQESH